LAHGNVEADRVPFREQPDLHEVAELVRDPETAASQLVDRRRLTAGEWIDEAPAVADLADDAPVLAPDPQETFAAAVAEAVARDLVQRHRKLAGPLAGEPRVVGGDGEESPDAFEVAGLKVQLGRVRRRWVERLLERRGEHVGPEVVGARTPVTALGDERMPAVRVLDDAVLERRRVVRAQQPEVARLGEGEVEQRLVSLAL